MTKEDENRTAGLAGNLKIWRAYTDKSQWPPGPWMDEPDFAVWRTRGLDCIVRRHPTYGHWRAYVELPIGHPWEKQHPTRITATGVECDGEYGEGYIEPHGECTFGPAKHLPWLPSGSCERYWIGFDCGHGGMDWVPARGGEQGTVYRHFAYVVKRCQWLADQAYAAHTYRHTCTKDDPWTPDKGRRAKHPDASEVGDQSDGWPGGDTVAYKCPHCGTSWREELPQ